MYFMVDIKFDILSIDFQQIHPINAPYHLHLGDVILDINQRYTSSLIVLTKEFSLVVLTKKFTYYMLETIISNIMIDTGLKSN